MSNSSTENKFVNQQIQYLEFVSSDLERAKAFYSTSFGWEFTDYERPSIYSFWRKIC